MSSYIMTMLLRPTLFLCATAIVAGPAMAAPASAPPKDPVCVALGPGLLLCVGGSSETVTITSARLADGNEELHRRGTKATADTIASKDEKKDRTPASAPIPARKKSVKTPRTTTESSPIVPESRDVQDEPWDTAFLVDNVTPLMLRTQAWRLVGNERYR